MHYYDEDDIDIGKPLTNCKVVVNHTIVPVSYTHLDVYKRQTQIYAKVTDKKVGEDMKGLKTRTTGQKIVLCEEDVSVMKKKRAQSDKEKAAFA